MQQMERRDGLLLIDICASYASQLLFTGCYICSETSVGPTLISVVRFLPSHALADENLAEDAVQVQ